MNWKEVDKEITNNEVIDEKQFEVENSFISETKLTSKRNVDNKNIDQECVDVKDCYDNEKVNLSDANLKSAIERQRYNTYSYYLISFYAGLCSITELAVAFYFKDILKIEPAELTRLMAIVVIPWSLKPFLGLLTDFVPILGYKRKYYILLCGLVPCICWILMALTSPSIISTFFLLLLINVCNSFSSVLGEAIVVELSKEKSIILKSEENYNLIPNENQQNDNRSQRSLVNRNNNNNNIGNTENENNNNNSIGKDDQKEKAKDYVSLWMIFKYVGVLFASFMKGSLVETIGIKGVFIIGIFIPTLVIIAGIILKDKNVNLMNNQNQEQNNYSTISETGGQAQNNEENIVQIQHLNEVVSFRDVISFIFQKEILIPIAFIVCFMATPSYSDPFFYFLTNELKFSATTLGKISFFSTIGVLIGIFLYKQFFKNSSFKNVIIGATILSFCFSFCGYALVMRYNTKIGISDFFLVLVSNSFLSMLGEIMLLPMLSIACVLCPKNMEGTIFSVFMSALNFGGVISGLLGSIITSHLGITSTNYERLPTLIIISNLLTLAPLPFLCLVDSKYFKH